MTRKSLVYETIGSFTIIHVLVRNTLFRYMLDLLVLEF